ncbi:copper resistance protein NlpE [Muriicola sp. Z0-33]|uniref:copper resistance protein NlpE n=1 Tax=Muriicola sp. Z0-33 TaxID=2816957 RepID=UPI0022370019|nr:copper resistance protein NlpE [Muriicola sp. Z0-33]MCW5515857.1 hypothetical protein [Muriicola sp. Z0-33]
MKSILLTVYCLLLSISLFSQSDNVVGGYFHTTGDKEEHLIEYSLTLYEDGTFSFHSYVNHSKGISWEENKYGKGNWSRDGKIVSFFTDKEKDIDEKHTLDFSDSKARFITRPARDKTDRIIKTRLRFFESKIFWIERMKIFKK